MTSAGYSSADYIVSGKYLLQDSSQQSLIEDGAIAIAGDTIAAVGKASSLQRTYPGARLIHEEQGLILPGLINSHTHAAMSCFRGLADDLPLMTWLEEHIFPIEAKLSPDMVYTSTLLSIAEMIKSGTTCFCDMYLFAGDVARAADETGIRAYIGEVLYDFPSPCYGPVENGITHVAELLREYRSNPLITITVDPHSVYTCSPDLLVRLGRLAEEHNSLFVIHLSENDAEVATCLERYGVGPVNHLDNLGLLSPATVACHCVKVAGTEFELLAENGVKVVHCGESNMKLASGVAPVVDLLAHGITVSLGTDGSASNNDVDMFGEMNSVAKMQKVISGDPTVMSAEQTLFAATAGGARTLGAGDMLGTLHAGKKGDFIVIDLNQPHLTPVYNLPSHLTYAVRGADVIHSFVGGRQLMKDRRLLTIDEERLLLEMREMGATILNWDR